MRVSKPAALDGDDGLVDDVLSWVHEAGNPYLSWLLGGPEAASAVLAARMRDPASEISVRDATLLRDDTGETIGGYIALPGAELARRRRADAVAYLQSAGRAGRAALTARMQDARDLFAPVEPDAFYLSKIGVRPGERGHGHGRVLLDHFLAAGAATGTRLFALDVSEGNAGAIHLYESRGFRTVARSRLPGTDIAYVSMRLDAEG
ncbi:MAG TPA: GNAT family N-acetyltransferase [Pseudonocardia sp.]|nr:GNAT family N-acetyltransferase [Pseudonocardia sp.]